MTAFKLHRNISPKVALSVHPVSFAHVACSGLSPIWPENVLHVCNNVHECIIICVCVRIHHLTAYARLSDSKESWLQFGNSCPHYPHVTKNPRPNATALIGCLHSKRCVAQPRASGVRVYTASTCLHDLRPFYICMCTRSRSRRFWPRAHTPSSKPPLYTHILLNTCSFFSQKSLQFFLLLLHQLLA